MKDQINTIREALEAIRANSTDFDSGLSAHNALKILTQLEAMVGEPWLDERGYTLTSLHTAAPVAQQQAEAAKCDYPECSKACGNASGYCHKEHKQPQAEAVPQAAVFCWLVEHFDGDGTGNSTGHYYTGKIGIADRVLTTMEASQAKRYDTWREANLASVKLGSTLTGTWRAVQHGFHTIPQQAEAPPSDVVRDAVAAEREACAALAQGYAGQVGDVAWAVAAAIRGRGKAAIAQQKGN